MHQIEKLGFLGIARNNFELKGLIGLCTEKFEFLDSVDFGGVVFSVEFVIHHLLKSRFAKPAEKLDEFDASIQKDNSTCLFSEIVFLQSRSLIYI